MALIGCPADAADRLSELALAAAGSVSCGRTGTGAVDGGDLGLMGRDKVNDLLARQPGLQGQELAIIDDRNIEALAPPAHINADPHRHGDSMPAPGRRRGLRVHLPAGVFACSR